MRKHDVPVVVVGGSLVGLSTSLLLAAHEVPHLLVERHRGTAIHPRAASFHQRTMEIFRGVGLQAEIEAAAEKEFLQNGAIVAVESLSGKELAYFFRSYNEGVEGLSPTSRLFITQVGLEPLLRDRAQELGADHRYGTELVDFAQDDGGVVSVIRPRDGGPETTVRSQYLVAADGAHSFVRERLGVPMLGRGSFADCVTIYFKADVRDLIGDRNLSVVYVSHPELLGFFRFSITGDAGFLAVFAEIGPDGSRDSHVADDLTSERCVALVRKALGSRPDLPVEVDSVQRWTASAGWAERFTDGRVFLAGDAAHVMPPTGGFGGNTGVADAHNLAWKLAMVVDGTAGPGLLDTYEPERRPVCASTVEQAYTRYVSRVDSTLSKDGMAAPLDDPSIELGAVYRSSGVVGQDGTSAGGTPFEDPRQPSGRPGTRLPHLALESGGSATPVHDVLGRRFVLLAGPAGQDWCDAAEAIAEGTGIPLDSHRVGADGELVDEKETFTRTLALSPGGAVVVRPDGVIAWRAEDPDGDHRATLEQVMRGLTFREVG